MVDVTPLVKKGAQIIQSYSSGQFKISGEIYESAVVVGVDKTHVWDVEAENLKPEDFAFLKNSKNDVVLFGTGAMQKFPDPAINKYLRQNNIHLDIMDTGAACRTFNVLIAEGRRVIAVLLPV